MMNFPLYPVRHYQEVFSEGIYKVIQTNISRYVLDLNITGNYVDKRLAILADPHKPYPIYPLRNGIANLEDLASSDKRIFIDSEGRVVKWKPTKFYDVVCLRVTNSFTNSKGKTVLEVDSIHTKFIVSTPATKFVQVIKFGNRYILYSTCNDKRQKSRKKL